MKTSFLGKSQVVKTQVYPSRQDSKLFNTNMSFAEKINFRNESDHNEDSDHLKEDFTLGCLGCCTAYENI